MEQYDYIGKSFVRVDGKEKITGSATFTEDIDFGQTLLYAYIIESPFAHAVINSIDISRAEKVPGVIAVVTGKDFPYMFGMYMSDRYIFAQKKVRFVGEQVAAVIAETQYIAIKAAKLVKVDYTKLAPVLTVEEAMREKEHLVHPELIKYKHVPWFFPVNNTNIAHLRRVRKGNTAREMLKAQHVFEDVYRIPRYAHCPIETHNAIGKFDYSGRLTIWSASQSPYTQRDIFAKALAPLGLKHKDIRVITPYVGGGFGGKAGVSMEILAAVLAIKARGRAVKVMWSRSQEFYNTYQRQGLLGKIKTGINNEGKIIALEQELYWDAGAYVEYAANVTNAAGISATGPYKIPNVYIDSYCMYTNLPPSGPYRGFGYSEFLFCLESHLNDIAKKLNVDPIELRKRNIIKEGDSLPYGKPMNSNGLEECIQKVEKSIDDWSKELKSDNPEIAKGKGISLFWKAPAMPPNASSSAFLKFNEDASINVLVSGMELGQGFYTVMTQIVAEVLKIPPENIRVETPDTDRNPYEWQTVASHVTWSCGNAVKIAAEDAKNQIFDLIERTLGKSRKDLYLENSKVKSRKEAKFQMQLKDFVISGIMMKDGTYRGGPINGRGMFMPEFASALSDPKTSQGGKPNVHYTVGACGAFVEIDKMTGKIHIPKIVFAIDCGRALNPKLIHGQVTGGVLQGIATALYEDIKFDLNGKMLNPNFTDYKIPTSKDIPGEIQAFLIEKAQLDGPFGARGVGEHTMIPVPAAIRNAIADALDIRMNSMPLTPQKIVRMIKQKWKTSLILKSRSLLHY